MQTLSSLVAAETRDPTQIYPNKATGHPTCDALVHLQYLSPSTAFMTYGDLPVHVQAEDLSLASDTNQTHGCLNHTIDCQGDRHGPVHTRPHIRPVYPTGYTLLYVCLTDEGMTS